MRLALVCSTATDQLQFVVLGAGVRVVSAAVIKRESAVCQLTRNLGGRFLVRDVDYGSDTSVEQRTWLANIKRMADPK